MRGEEYARFSRIVFDTAPTGHTLRLLTVPDFVEAALAKLIRLRKKLTAAGDAVRGIFGVHNQDVAIQKLEALRVIGLPRYLVEMLDCMHHTALRQLQAPLASSDHF